MRKQQKWMLVLAVMAVFMATVLFLPGPIGAGQLDPPGPPTTGTMRTLDEIYKKLNTIEYKLNQMQEHAGGQFTYYIDDDGDGYGDPNNTTLSVEQPPGYVTDNTDCDDTDAAINPGAAEVLNSEIDENCDGTSETVRFVDNGDGTVRDHKTGLIWLKNANHFWKMQWWHAIDYADNLVFGGYSDWRLPTKEEWEAFVDRSYSSPALCNTACDGQWEEGDAFYNVQDSYYWSSTPGPDYTYFSMGMPTGQIQHWYGSSYCYVWPVRDDN